MQRCVGRNGVVGKRCGGVGQVLPGVHEAQVGGLGEVGAQGEEGAQCGNGGVGGYRERDCWRTSVLRI